MFEGAGGSERADLWSELGTLDVAVLARLARENLVETIRVQNRILLIAAAWADAHPGDPNAPRTGPASMLVERPKRLGGDGTPDVAEGAAFELGVIRDLGESAAEWLIADALDLRHRLPLLWAGVVAGGVEGCKGRKVAQATRHLTQSAAATIDRQLSPFLGQLSWRRAQTLLDAAVIAADPEQAARDAEHAAGAKGVWSAQTNHCGLKSIYARTDAGNAVWFMGLVNRIADLLKADGDCRTVDERRAAAIGIIAQPPQAMALLHRHSQASSKVTDPGSTPQSSEETPLDPFDLDLLDLGLDNEDAGDDPDPDGLGFEDLPLYCGPDDWAPGPWERRTDQPEPHTGTADEPDFVGDDDRPLDQFGGLDLRLPAAFDAASARPRVVLHYHLSEAGLRAVDDHALVRPEHADPTTLKVLVDFLAGTGCQIRVQPVIDPAAVAPVDAYEIPDKIRNAVRYRDIADVAPWGTGMSRSLDLDHTKPYEWGGPPGQTALSRLGPLTRTVHRIKTLGIAKVRQPDAGLFIWRTRHGHLAISTNRGTLYLGDTEFTHALWRAADHDQV